MQIVTVSYGLVSGKAKNYPYYQPALYEAVEIKSKGHLAWKKVKHLGSARRSRKIAEQDAKDFAQQYKCYYGYARQYVKVDQKYLNN